MDRAASAGQAGQTPTRGLILVAEDDPISQLFLQHQLMRFGHAADLVADGVEALAAYASGDYRLILTDCHMPAMDGFALARAIREREHDAGRRPAIVAIAANANPSEGDRCRAAGMDDILYKPVQVETVGAMLDRWLPKDVAASRPDAPRRKPDPPTRITTGTDYDGGASISPIDMAMLSQLLDTEDGAYLKRMIGVYWDTVRNTPAELAELISANDASALRDAAHAAKGASTSVGAIALSSLLKELQATAADADWERIADLMPRIEAAFADLERFIGTLRAI
jgi:CheY-like chemotaxis protein